MLSILDIERGFQKLGIIGKPIVFHTSFKSLGDVEGGLDGYVKKVIQLFPTVMVPGFTFESSCPAPLNDRPLRNGIDYSKGWISPQIPFDPATASIDKKMGAFPRKIWELPEARRSEHPWHSWIAYGEGAKELVQNHSWDRAHEPLERLAERGGWVVMVGVTIFYCTALHLAEERSGRRAFIRWAKDKNGLVKRISVGGCANWFDPFFPQVEHLFKWTQIGNAAVLAAPLRQLVEVSADLIHKNPQLAVCSSDCLKCKDALAGGPLEVK